MPQGCVAQAMCDTVIGRPQARHTPIDQGLGHNKYWAKQRRWAAACRLPQATSVSQGGESLSLARTKYSKHRWLKRSPRLACWSPRRPWYFLFVLGRVVMYMYKTGGCMFRYYSTCWSTVLRLHTRPRISRAPVSKLIFLDRSAWVAHSLRRDDQGPQRSQCDMVRLRMRTRRVTGAGLVAPFHCRGAAHSSEALKTAYSFMINFRRGAELSLVCLAAYSG